MIELISYRHNHHLINSSSTHSIAFFPNVKRKQEKLNYSKNDNDHYYGWDNFTIEKLGDKLYYVASMIHAAFRMPQKYSGRQVKTGQCPVKGGT